MEEEVLHKTIDPVCGMEVSTDSDFFTYYDGEMYYFCSQEDKDEFDRSPAEYVERQKVTQDFEEGEQ